MASLFFNWHLPPYEWSKFWKYWSLVRAFMFPSAQNPTCSSEFGYLKTRIKLQNNYLVFLRFITSCQRWVIFQTNICFDIFRRVFCIYKCLPRKNESGCRQDLSMLLAKHLCFLSKGILRNEWRLACQNLQNVEIFVHRRLLACQLPFMLKKADI